MAVSEPLRIFLEMDHLDKFWRDSGLFVVFTGSRLPSRVARRKHTKSSHASFTGLFEYWACIYHSMLFLREKIMCLRWGVESHGMQLLACSLWMRTTTPRLLYLHQGNYRPSWRGTPAKSLCGAGMGNMAVWVLGRASVDPWAYLLGDTH